MWHCVWSDEFDGTSLSSTWQAIPYGLGSSCLFNDPNHVQVRDGELHLIASRLPSNHWCTAEWGLEYGGGGIQTDTFAQQYGRFEIRAKLPAGAGLWPAFWLLPADQSFNGEIDVLEAYGGRNALGDATIHSPANGPGPQRSCPILPSPYTDFHTYRLEWQHGRIQMYYDDKLCADITGMSDAGVSPPPLPKVFDQPYHILLNLAVQPWWPPDASTTLPATMQIDYVRVWR